MLRQPPRSLSIPVTAQINVTADGFCNHDDVAIDDDFMRFAATCIDEADRLVLGRKTYDLFVAHWPAAAKDKSLPEAEQALGRAIDGTPRTVVSRSLAHSDWAGTDLLADLDADRAATLAASDDLLILGSPSIIDQFAGWGLLDRLLLSVHPLLGRSGHRLFEKGHAEGMIYVGSTSTGADIRTLEFARPS